MPDPQIAARHPAQVHLEPGTYWWCACGLSKAQPFCDGSHKGSGLGPLKLEVTEARECWLCQCKHSQDKPWCDGTHKTL